MPLISPASRMFEHQTYGLTERPYTRRCASGNIKIWTNTITNTKDFQNFMTVTPRDKSNKNQTRSVIIAVLERMVQWHLHDKSRILFSHLN